MRTTVRSSRANTIETEIIAGQCAIARTAAWMALLHTRLSSL